MQDFTLAHAHFAELPWAAGLSDTSPEALRAALAQHKLDDADYDAIARLLAGRSPSWTELGVFSALWNEHCSYKSSKFHLKRLPSHGPRVVVPPGENAGVVRLEGELCVAFKMESHNHPSYIDPYQGAATGVGGILRDVFCMGARPICNLNALRFGEPSHPKTPYLLKGVVAGIGDYGNCVGIPTVGGSLAFDPSYNGNILVNAMSVGLIAADAIGSGSAGGTGNLVVYVGAATGCDGIHGATMASDSFASAAAQERSAVQVGDPFYEKLLLEATLEALQAGLVVGLQDMGAAGLTSSLFEMAERAGSGLFIDLSQVPTRSAGMSAYELMLSESQERMAMVVTPAAWPRLTAIFERWQLAYAVIGQVTDSGRFQAVLHGRREIDIPLQPLAAATPRYERPLKARPLPQASNEAAFASRCEAAFQGRTWPSILERLLQHSGDKSWLYEQYDHHIGLRTCQSAREEGAALLWIRSPLSMATAPYLGLGVATAGLERLCRLQPRWGASYSVLKAARMLAAAGVEPLAVTDCLNYGNPQQPEVMWELSEGIDGIAAACTALGLPVVSGNVSLYNETDGQSIAPTPMIGMIGRSQDVRQSKKAICNGSGELWMLSPQEDASPFWAGSLAVATFALPLGEGFVPEPNWQAEQEAMRLVCSLQHEADVTAIRDIGDGGLVGTALKMVLGQGLGLDLFEPPSSAHSTPYAYYLAQRPASYLVVVATGSQLAQSFHSQEVGTCCWRQVGTITPASTQLVIGGQSCAYSALSKAWQEGLPSLSHAMTEKGHSHATASQA